MQNGILRIVEEEIEHRTLYVINVQVTSKLSNEELGN